MSDPRTPRSYVERHRFGRVGRIPSPTPFPVGGVFPTLEREAGVERARIVERPA
jgi:hypothetical protein